MPRPRLNVTKLLTAVIYQCSLQARVFVPGKHFQPSLMFSGELRAFPCVANFGCSTQG
jgi:hypothetical protein